MKVLCITTLLLFVTNAFAGDPTFQVPDGGATFALLAGALAVMSCVSRAIKRK